MRKHFLHKLGAFIFAVVMLSGVGMLASSTAQARSHRGVVFVPRVYIGPGPYYRNWHQHRHFHRW
jgi:hypothetical protein